jgi:hypothetical protein
MISQGHGVPRGQVLATYPFRLPFCLKFEPRCRAAIVNLVWLTTLAHSLGESLP